MAFHLTAQLLYTYGGPPLIGAFIGYLTNDIAIRMLFRPLHPWRICGIRVPFTPGIIPSKRHQFAENIGAMVGDQLLTSQDIGAAMSAERFQAHLRLIAEEKVNDFLGKELGPLLNLVPQPFRVHAKIGLRTLKHQVRTGILTYLRSPACAKAVNVALADQLRRLGSRKLDELLRPDDRQDLYAALAALSTGVLTEPATAARLTSWIETALTEAAVAGKTVGDLLPTSLRELACTLIAEHAPQVLAEAAVIMAEPSIRAKVAQAVRGGIDHFIDNLGPMAAMAKGFLNMDSLDGLISTWLTEHEGNLAAWMKQPEIETRTAEALRKQAETFFATPLAELLVKVEPEQLRRVCQQAATQLLTSLAEGQLLPSLLREQLEALLEHGQISLADLSGRLPLASRRKLRQALSNELHALTDSEPLRRLVSRLINSLLDQLVARPTSVLRDLLPTELRRSIIDYLVLTANRLLIREVPGLTESLRIRELVRNKVDSLDLLRLERLLLSIMEEQFKYINLFGALLGFLIGLINVAVMGLL
ncbi:DUF445 family protein [Candidatus Electronema sp. PJ]|uniref:DUF445 family protein n=1 Tax=Candidatus Electronema sp. PJ TaxID=3401572 RepID=UPI003AA99C6B